jgi:5-methyltetrahydropteroyltriglutamate--homocysteine methyltransferase
LQWSVRAVVSRSGGYEWLAGRPFGELAADRFIFEHDSEATGGLKWFQFLPRGETVVVVTSNDAMLESQGDSFRRIEQSAKFGSIEQVALSPSVASEVSRTTTS